MESLVGDDAGLTIRAAQSRSSTAREDLRGFRVRHNRRCRAPRDPAGYFEPILTEPAPDAGVGDGLKKGFWIEAGVASAVIFLIAPLLLASTNEPHPLRLPLGVWLGLAVLAGVSFVLLVLIQYGATAMGVGSASAQVTRFVCYFVVLSCFAFPLVRHSGQVELEDMKPNVVNIIVCFTLAGGLLWASRGRLRLVRLGVLAYVIGNLVLVGYSFASDPSSTLRSLPISSLPTSSSLVSTG